MITLKPATENDFGQIATLAREIWDEHYIAIITQEQIDYMLQKMYSHHAMVQQCSEGQIFYLIMNQRNEAIGFISISRKGNDFWLHKFYILPQKQNSGIGAEVFKKVFIEQYKPDTVRLTVNRKNYKSINFYFKLGFKIEKVADFDIGNNYFMNDFVMLWNAPK
jgi:GNAT superfamily N-acetyltransferase